MKDLMLRHNVDPFVNGHIKAWQEGRFASFESMLIHLCVRLSQDRCGSSEWQKTLNAEKARIAAEQAQASLGGRS